MVVMVCGVPKRCWVKSHRAHAHSFFSHKLASGIVLVQQAYATRHDHTVQLVSPPITMNLTRYKRALVPGIARFKYCHPCLSWYTLLCICSLFKYIYLSLHMLDRVAGKESPIVIGNLTISNKS